MMNYGMGQHFNPHTIRGKTIKEIMLKHCESRWISDEEGCENMRKNGQREFVIDLLEKMAEKVRNGAYVPEDDVRAIISMQAHWKKGQFRDEQNVNKGKDIER